MKRENILDHLDDSQELLDSLQSGLLVDKNALDEALENQPDLFHRVSRRLEMLISLRDEAKQKLQETEAEADIDIREEARASDKKITEREIESLRKVDSEVVIASKKYLTLSRLVGQFKAMKEAYEQRSFALNNMVNLYGANYYSDISGSESSKKYRRADAGYAKEKLVEERRRRASE